MAVYVDEAVWEWRGRKWCHLLADSLSELHAFARRLGLQRSWFQKDSSYPHYDLTDAKREQALRLGAQAANRREIITVAKRLRAEASSAPAAPPKTGDLLSCSETGQLIFPLDKP